MVREGFLALLLVGCAGPSPRPSARVSQEVTSASAAPPAPPAPPVPPARGEVTMSRLAAIDSPWFAPDLKEDRWMPLDGGKVRACYGEQLARAPGVAGWLLLRAVVGPSGGLTDLALTEQQGLPPELVRCVLQAQKASVEAPETSRMEFAVYVRFR